VSPEELEAWAKERVAAYKYPRHVVLVGELPKSPTGKILKREIDPALLELTYRRSDTMRR
jgi:long-chain acyl-CoA synthetase